MSEPSAKWRATVRQVTGATHHVLATRGGEVEIPPARSVEIVQEDNGYLLLRLNDRGDCLADTWHATLDEAKAQAAFEFDIREEDWRAEGL